VYAGKRVGLLDGTYNVHAQCMKGGMHACALAINGGPSADQPTVIAAVNPRKAILTGADPVTGAYPTNAAAIIGQGYLQTKNKGNLIIDGLYLTRSYQYAICFDAPAGTEFTKHLVEGGSTGIVVRNCEIYDISGLINNNVAGILLMLVTGALISNNKIHSVQPPNVGNANIADCAGILSFNCHSNIYEFNTIYDCNVGIYDKNNYNGNQTFRYNYIECLGLTPSAPLIDCSGGNPGDTLTVHNNIFVGPTVWFGLDALSQPSVQSLVFYNNTCMFGTPGRETDTGFFYPAAGGAASPAATVTFYNNIVQCAGKIGSGGLVAVCPGSVSLSDYNALSVAGNSQIMAYSPPKNPRGFQPMTLAQWRSLTGMDKHTSTTSSQFANAQDRTAAGLQLRSGSPGQGTGRVGGLVSGAATDIGAWGAGATQIGCNFGPSPKATSLSVS
jgi:hypothetical protein